MKRAFVIGFSLIWKIYFGIVFISLLIISYPVFYFLFKRKPPFLTAFRLIRVMARIYSLLFGLRIQHIGSPEFPADRQYIICANHTSYLDIIIPYTFLPDYFVFLGKRELGKVPLFNIFFKEMNLLVDRGSRQDAVNSYQECSDRLKKGENVLIFPEGGIKDGAPQLHNFKSGLFRMAIEQQIPILPVVFLDNYKRMEDNGWLSKTTPGKARVVHLPLIETKGLNSKDLVTLKDRVHEQMQETLKAHNVID